MKIYTIRRMFIPTLLAIVMCIAPISGAFAQEGASEGPDWFVLHEETAEQWRMEYSPAEPTRLLLLQKTPEAGPEQQVYVLYSKRSSAYDTAMRIITEIFISKNINAEFTVVNFDGVQELGLQALSEIQNGDFDLLYTAGSVATAFVFENRPLLDLPIVSVTSKDPVLLGQIADYETGSGHNMAFTSLNIPTDVQMTYLRELRPQLKNIGIIYARNNTSAYETQVLPLVKRVGSENIRLIEVVVEDQDNAREELQSLVPQAISDMQSTDPDLEDSIFFITGSTSVFREIATINRFAGLVPVLSMVTDVVSQGEDSAVLAIGVGFESNAHLAAIYGTDILDGRATPGDLKVGVVSPPDIAINFLKARTIGLKIPFSLFELATVVYGADGNLMRSRAIPIVGQNP